MVPEVGIEPTLGFPNQILSLARLPVSPLRQRVRNYKEFGIEKPDTALVVSS
jgi:hypothetical protein